MKKITKKQFLADVEHEIDMLKLHATDEEKEYLDFDSFDPDKPKKCIYGQITGNCNSHRAMQLMQLGCVRIVHNPGNRAYKFTEMKPRINGAFMPETWDRDRDDFPNFLSCLEAYILLDDAKNKQIIQYIKGETDTLTL